MKSQIFTLYTSSYFYKEKLLFLTITVKLLIKRWDWNPTTSQKLLCLNTFSQKISYLKMVIKKWKKNNLTKLLKNGKKNISKNKLETIN